MHKIFLKYSAMPALICVLFIMCLPGGKAHASSADIEFSTEAESIRIGDEFTVTLAITSDVAPGEFAGYVSYDGALLEYVSGPDCAAGGEGILRIYDEALTESSYSREYLLTFRASRLGTASIAMRGTPELYEAGTGFLMSVSSNMLNLEILPDDRASSDATLAALKINPGVLSPEFETGVFEYTTAVDNGVESIIISAVANDLNATVKIEGNTGLSVGQNRVLILVTAEDGTKEKYVIYVARAKAEEPETEPDNPDSTDDTKEDGTAGEPGTDDADTAKNTAPDTSGQPDAGTAAESGFVFYADGDGETIRLHTGSEYRVCANDGSIDIPEGYFKTTIVISGYTVAAYSPSEDLSSDYLLLILAKEGAAPGLYMFDRVEKTLQRYSGRISTRSSVTATGYSTLEEQTLVDGYEKSLRNLTFVIAALCGICMLLLIITIRLATGRKNARKRR